MGGDGEGGGRVAVGRAAVWAHDGQAARVRQRYRTLSPSAFSLCRALGQKIQTQKQLRIESSIVLLREIIALIIR